MSEICEQIVIDLWSGKVDDVKTWIQDNPNVLNQLYKHGDNDQRDTLLNLAAKKGNLEMLKLLLGKGSDANTIGLDGANALHCSTPSDEILK